LQKQFKEPSNTKKLLGWETIYPLEETISETVDWYKHFIKNSDMKKISIYQIKNYVKKAKQNNIVWANS